VLIHVVSLLLTVRQIGLHGRHSTKTVSYLGRYQDRQHCQVSQTSSHLLHIYGETKMWQNFKYNGKTLTKVLPKFLSFPFLSPLITTIILCHHLAGSEDKELYFKFLYGRKILLRAGNTVKSSRRVPRKRKD